MEEPAGALPTHPFASRIYRLNEKLRKIRDDMKKAKDKGDRMPTRPGSGGGGGGEPGGLGRPALPGKKPRVGGPDQTYNKLKANADRERMMCNTRRARANEAYYRCRATPGQTAASCKGLFVQVSCPAAERAQRALDEYVVQLNGGRIGGITEDDKAQANSGGGGGGGF